MTDIVHFYQTGTFTAGNRLLDTTERTIQASVLIRLPLVTAPVRVVAKLWVLVML